MGLFLLLIFPWLLLREFSMGCFWHHEGNIFSVTIFQGWGFWVHTAGVVISYDEGFFFLLCWFWLLLMLYM